MKLGKSVSILFSVMLCTNIAFAQQEIKETTVEDEYLSSVEDVIIRELADANDRDNKFVSLQYIQSAIEAGRSSPDIQYALESLAGEGLSSQTRENGRLMNNFPDVRARACELLGQIKTEESKVALVKIALADNEPMVVTSAIRSLGDIGINEKNEVVDTIIWVQKKYATLNPTSSLALECLFAYEKLAGSVVDKTPMIQSISSIASNYRFAAPVRAKAHELLKELTGTSDNKDKSTNKEGM